MGSIVGTKMTGSKPHGPRTYTDSHRLRSAPEPSHGVTRQIWTVPNQDDFGLTLNCGRTLCTFPVRDDSRWELRLSSSGLASVRALMRPAANFGEQTDLFGGPTLTNSLLDTRGMFSQ